MFYCDPCGRKANWPVATLAQSRGPCEVCNEVALCNDVPSTYLPRPPQEPKPSQKDLRPPVERRRKFYDQVFKDGGPVLAGHNQMIDGVVEEILKEPPGEDDLMVGIFMFIAELMRRADQVIGQIEPGHTPSELAVFWVGLALAEHDPELAARLFSYISSHSMGMMVISEAYGESISRAAKDLEERLAHRSD